VDIDLAQCLLKGEQLVNEVHSSALNKFDMLQLYNEIVNTFLKTFQDSTTSLTHMIVRVMNALLALGVVGGAVSFVACRNTYSRCCRLACCVPIALRDKVCRYSGGSTVGDQDQRARRTAIEFLLTDEYKKDEVKEVAIGVGIPTSEMYPTKRQNIRLLAKKIIDADPYGTREKDERYIKRLKEGTKRGG
jgi:hypothetical protein